MSVNNNDLKIDLLRKIHDLEMKGVEPRKTFNIEEPIENLIYEHTLLQKKYEKLCQEDKNKTYSKLSHFMDIVKNMSNEPNKITPYTDAQFEEDLKKWFAETKYKNNKRLK
jgi:hypothetical protein